MTLYFTEYDRYCLENDKQGNTFWIIKNNNPGNMSIINNVFKHLTMGYGSN